MFVVHVNYKVDLKVVDKYLPMHVEFLKEQYANNNFLASGRKVPRKGGVILADVESKEILLNILKEDPFFINDIAEYEVTEFVPSMTSKELEFLKV